MFPSTSFYSHVEFVYKNLDGNADILKNVSISKKEIYCDVEIVPSTVDKTFISCRQSPLQAFTLPESPQIKNRITGGVKGVPKVLGLSPGISPFGK